MSNTPKELAEFTFDDGSGTFLVEVDKIRSSSVERAALGDTEEGRQEVRRADSFDHDPQR